MYQVQVEAITCTHYTITKPWRCSFASCKLDALFVTTLYSASAALTITVQMMTPSFERQTWHSLSDYVTQLSRCGWCVQRQNCGRGTK